MALNIKNPEVERLAAEVAQITKETKTEAIRKALVERKQRLVVRPSRGSRSQRLKDYLENEVWPFLPPDALGEPISQEEQDEILGYGPHGV